MRQRVLPYKAGSKSAKMLADGLGTLRLKTRGSKFRPRRDDVIINWGLSVVPERLTGATFFNHPYKVGRASNKLHYFRTMKEAEPDIIPEFWTDRNDIPEDAYPVVCRTVLNGHSGEGIVIAEDESELVNAPLYVKYMQKKQEYRIHVGKGEVISIQRKARRMEVPDDEVDWRVRNHANGFIFARQNVTPPEGVTEAAVKALAAMELDFGAMDVIYNEHHRKAYVLEVNTAPGIEGSTVDDYVRFFKGDNDA